MLFKCDFVFEHNLKFFAFIFEKKNILKSIFEKFRSILFSNIFYFKSVVADITIKSLKV